ncbi:MAG TPA: carboxypeptidase-like regulatory domain-containing protein [Candidatus Thermoplasmatota archaeon]|nr:carboxypeptidase-like regulatory domain-containing protein [Candidatus Thermoplasmatota archaeon]
MPGLKPAILAWLAMATVLLAGCTGGAGPERPPSALDDVEVAPAEADKGAVAGLVVDESIRPVVGAAVSIAGVEVAATDEKGVFILDSLDPGLVIFAVAAEGFLPIQTSAEVRAGETAEVRVQLPRDLTPQPYRVTYSHDGFMQAWGGYGQYELENLDGGSAICDCRVYFTPEDGASTIVYEAYWEDSVSDPGDLAEFYWVVEQPEGEGEDAGYCFSPCIEHLGFGSHGFQPGVETYARLDGPDFWVEFQQSFQLFVTLWYNGEAPGGWTLRAG